MKKHILLTTTAMLLSAVALKANADSNSAQLDIRAMFLPPFEIETEHYLNFGIILNSGPNKTVIVTTDGKLGEGSTATMLSTARTNRSEVSNMEYIGGSFNEGLFRVKTGGLNVAPDADESMLNVGVLVNFSDTSVDLKNGSTKCGTVSNFTTRLKPSGNENEVLLHIGGTFTTSDITVSRACAGSTTVTLVLNDDALIQNGGL